MERPEQEALLEERQERHQQYEAGFDATALLHQLRRESLFSVDGGGGTLTSVADMEQLIAAAREEIRKAGRAKSKKADKNKAELAGALLSGGGEEGQGFPDKLAALLREVYPELPQVTVEYRNLCVEADALVGAASTPSIGNSVMGMLKRVTCQGGLKTRNVKVLKNMNGKLRPGSITLLLGPPGSGKSVFMQALSGRLQTGDGTRVTGCIKYNGQEASQFVLRRTAAYVDQLDYHIPSLTVLETTQFAHHCTTSLDTAAHFLAAIERTEERLERDAAVADMATAESAAAEEGKAGAESGGSEEAAAGKAPSGVHQVQDDPEFVSQMRQLVRQRGKPQILLQILGLQDVANTVVGDSMLRGISGGQRKRVTTAEILAGPQSLVLMDEISTGLDSATTYSVVQSLRQSVHSLQKTFVISLLQPAPEVVQLFDDILLLTDGHVVYHGPVSEILPFFESQLDFVCPVRKDAGSFLQEVTTPVGQYAYATAALLERRGLKEADRAPIKLLTAPPKDLLTSVEEMEDAFWKNTKWGQETLDQLDNRPFKPEAATAGSLFTTRYANSALHLTLLVIKRQFLLNKRDRSFYIARSLQAIVLGLIVASLWATITPTASEGRQVMSLGSLSVQSMAMMSMPQISLVFANKRIFYKQRDNNFYPPASYVLSYLLTQLPQSTVEVTLFSLVVYWISGLTRTAGNFFSFLAIIWSLSNCMAGFFRLIAYSVPSMVVANASGALMVLFLMITNGFSIVRTSIPKYLLWVYWINPLAWGVRGIVANELGTARWDIPSDPTNPESESLGKAVADSFSFFLGSEWVWGAVGVAWGSLLMYTLAGVCALTYTNPERPRPTVAEEEQKKEVKRGVYSMLRRGVTRSEKGALRPSPSKPALAKEEAAEADAAAGTVQIKSVVPFVPISLVCKNIRYFVNDPSGGTAPGVVKDSDDKEIAGKLELLKGLDLSAEPGSLTALMGGSGAGKTTLMDCILGRKTTGLIRGDILVNGHPKEQGTWSRVCGYVEQQDIHSAGTTIREALLFSARLRLEESIGMPQVHQIVDDTLEMVDLTALKDSIVGEPGSSGLSVEQRKRLSIAVELVANPSVVFMDEPTSGLDARAAAIVMRAVKNVSLSNRTVMVTIHQPSMEIFEAFDNLVLLQRGGRLTYFGPLGFESSALIAYLQAQPGVEPILPGYNPATWMLEVTGGSMSTTFKSAGHDFPALYADSQLQKDNAARMEALAEEGKKAHEPLRLTGVYATSGRTQRLVLIRKFFMLYWRNPNYNVVRFFMTACIGIVLGLVFLNEGDLTDATMISVSTVQNIMGLIFTLTIFLGMFNCMTVQPVMAAERVVFYRERSSSYYAAGPYAVASGVVELPYLVAQATLMVCITYWMVGFQAVAWRFFYFLLLYFLTLTMFTFFGQFLVFVTPNQLLAMLLSGFVNQLWSIFAGFMVPYPSMPAAWQWMNRISPSTWTLWGLVESQLGDNDTPMTGFGGQPTTISAFMTGAFGYTYGMIWWCVLILFGFCAFFRVISTLMLSYVNWQKR